MNVPERKLSQGEIMDNARRAELARVSNLKRPTAAQLRKRAANDGNWHTFSLTPRMGQIYPDSMEEVRVLHSEDFRSY